MVRNTGKIMAYGKHNFAYNKILFGYVWIKVLSNIFCQMFSNMHRLFAVLYVACVMIGGGDTLVEFHAIQKKKRENEKCLVLYYAMILRIISHTHTFIGSL